MIYSSKFPSKSWEIIRKSQDKQNVILPTEKSHKSIDQIRFVVIADTHNGHANISVPDGDVLLVCGDLTLYGEDDQLNSFDKFLGTLSHSRKILIGGNHDWSLSNSKKLQFKFKNGEYLQDTSTNAFGYKIYGTPWTPVHFRGAFMLERGKSLIEKWDMIPDDTDILMTHTPPVGYGDKLMSNTHVGDVDLLLAVQNRIKPSFHVFGHIHEDKGSWSDGTTIFINSSICNQRYRPVNSASIFDLPLI